MNFINAVNKLDHETYTQLKNAIECRKWPDGRNLTKQQIEICLEAILIFEHNNSIAEEERTGYLPQTSCKETKTQQPDDTKSTLKWV